MKACTLPVRTVIGWRTVQAEQKKLDHRAQFEYAKKISGASSLGKQARSKNASFLRKQKKERR